MLSHRNLMAMTVAHLADFDAPDEDCSLVHGAPMSHGSGLYIPAVRAARRAAGDTGIRCVRAGGVPRSLRAPSGLQRLPRAHHGAALGADRTRLPAQSANGGLRRGPDVRGQPEEGDGRVRPDLRTALRARRGADDDHRACAEPTTSEADDAILGSVGYARSGVDVAVLRDDGTPAAIGEIGEIVCRGDVVMSGYWNNPERDRGHRCRTAGCAPATWDRSTTGATSLCATARRTW